MNDTSPSPRTGTVVAEPFFPSFAASDRGPDEEQESASEKGPDGNLLNNRESSPDEDPEISLDEDQEISPEEEREIDRAITETLVRLLRANVPYMRIHGEIHRDEVNSKSKLLERLRRLLPGSDDPET